jgi:hypothetical protein
MAHCDQFNVQLLVMENIFAKQSKMPAQDAGCAILWVRSGHGSRVGGNF